MLTSIHFDFTVSSLLLTMAYIVVCIIIFYTIPFV